MSDNLPVLISIKNNIWKFYLLLLPFQVIFSFHYLGYTFQIPEIILILLVIVSFKKIKKKSSEFWNSIDIFVLLWPIVNMFPSFFNGVNIYNIIGISRAIYVVGIYFFVRLISDEPLVRNFHKAIVDSSVVAACFGIVGWTLYTFFDIQTSLVVVRPYPYFGQAAQAVAFTSCPNMLASFLMIGIIFQFSYCIENKEYIKNSQLTILLVLLLCFLTTLSKTIICLIAGIATSYLLWRRTRRRYLNTKIHYVVIFISIIVYTLGTHFVFLPIRENSNDLMIRDSYISSFFLLKLKINNTEYGIYPTNYYYNKRSSMIAFLRSNWLGIGAANYNNFIGTLQNEGLHPPSFPRWDPHSTYFGSMAELGIFGIVDILTIMFIVIIIFNKVDYTIIYDRNLFVLKISLAGSFVAIAIEAIATDIMNKRHYWWLLAITRCLLDFLPSQQQTAQEH